jgi:hypothetical protein
VQEETAALRNFDWTYVRSGVDAVLYEARQREREKREAAEIEAAKERDRQAYRERGWPA